MTQTLALLLDAYRELNAKRLFWFTLCISGIVVASFAMISNNERGLQVMWWTLDLPVLATSVIPADQFHKLFFVNLGLGVWLTWIAMILALVSTASIFPDFLAGGAIELMLSKPIGRLRLFATKYIAALLFVGLQVGIFTLASFLVIGYHGGGWVPAIFLAVPIVVLVYSYLFSVCVLIGTLWRSTIAALMLTLLAWGLIFMGNSAELGLLLIKTGMGENARWQESRIEALKAAIAVDQSTSEEGEGKPSAPNDERPKEGGLLAGLRWAAQKSQQEQLSGSARLKERQERLVRLETTLAEHRDKLAKVEWWHGMVFGLKTALPKTAETTSLVERYILDLGKLQALSATAESQPQVSISTSEPGEEPRESDDEQVGREVQRILHARSEWWVIGTSLGFEAVVLGLAAWIFCRRDF